MPPCSFNISIPFKQLINTEPRKFLVGLHLKYFLFRCAVGWYLRSVLCVRGRYILAHICYFLLFIFIVHTRLKMSLLYCFSVLGYIIRLLYFIWNCFYICMYVWYVQYSTTYLRVHTYLRSYITFSSSGTDPVQFSSDDMSDMNAPIKTVNVTKLWCIAHFAPGTPSFVCCDVFEQLTQRRKKLRNMKWNENI